MNVIRRDEPLEKRNTAHTDDKSMEVEFEAEQSGLVASDGALMFLRPEPSHGGETAEVSTSGSPVSSGYTVSGTEGTESSDVQPSPQFLQLVGLWDRLSAEIQHIPGNPSVVANAMKVCVSNTSGSIDVLKRGMTLCTRLAELGGEYSTLESTGGSENERTISMTTDVIAAAMLSEVFPSLNMFPSSIVRSKVSRGVAMVAEDVLKVRQLADRIDVYEDGAVQAARRMCLAFYDVSSIVIEVIRRVIGLEEVVLAGCQGAAGYRYQADALEAVQLYAPLGHALGLKSLSLTLENAALELLFPTSHKKTSEWLDTYVSLHDAILESARRHLEDAIMADAEFLAKAERVEVQARTKSAISTLKKLLRLGNLQEGGRKREEVFDVLGLRIIVVPKQVGADGLECEMDAEAAETAAVEACYVVERIVANMWPVIEARSKDYIASPKPNGYSSIHKSVIVADQGVLFDEATTVEVQIRTASMHHMAELGNAAHSAYKGGLTVSQTRSLREVQDQKMHELLASSDASVGYDAGEGLFRAIDANGDGQVSLSELRAVLEELGDVGADSLLEQFDLNNDGVISLEEFMEFQKAMGLSSAISLIDERYARSVPKVIDATLRSTSSSSIKPYTGGHSVIKQAKGPVGNSSHDDASTGAGSTSSALHVWGPGSHFSFRDVPTTRNKAMAFTDGDEAGSLHGSLDEPRAPSPDTQGCQATPHVRDSYRSSQRQCGGRPGRDTQSSRTARTVADSPNSANGSAHESALDRVVQGRGPRTRRLRRQRRHRRRQLPERPTTPRSSDDAAARQRHAPALLKGRDRRRSRRPGPSSPSMPSRSPTPRASPSRSGEASICPRHGPIDRRRRCRTATTTLVIDMCPPYLGAPRVALEVIRDRARTACPSACDHGSWDPPTASGSTAPRSRRTRRSASSPATSSASPSPGSPSRSTPSSPSRAQAPCPSETPRRAGESGVAPHGPAVARRSLRRRDPRGPGRLGGHLCPVDGLVVLYLRRRPRRRPTPSTEKLLNRPASSRVPTCCSWARR